MTETMLYVNVYALLVLLIVMIGFKKHSDFKLYKHKAFMVLLILTLMILITDSLHAALNGIATFPYALFNALSVLLFLLPTAIALCWLYMTAAFFEQKRPKARWIIYLIHLPLAVNVTLAFLSLFTGSFFETGLDNTYQRGPLYFVYFLVIYLYLAIAFINIILHYKTMRRDHFYPFLFFALPPATVGMFQILFARSPYTWAALVLSLLMVYLFVLSNKANTDYLTRLFNRREYEQKMQAYVKAAAKNRRFGVALVDLDGFKAINDVYGHKAGDDVLVAVAQILRDTFNRPNDTIARIGGDEFTVISPLEKNTSVETLKTRFLQALEVFNQNAGFPFELKASVSVLEYNQEESQDLEIFLKRLDDMLYMHKENTRR